MKVEPIVFGTLPLQLRALVVFDRDDTLIKNLENRSEFNEIDWLPKSKSLILGLNYFNVGIAIATNQAAVAKGLIRLDDPITVHRLMNLSFKSEHPHLHLLIYCPHYDLGVESDYSFLCECRKPQPGMLTVAKNLAGSDAPIIFVGNAISDKIAAERAAVPYVDINSSRAFQMIMDWVSVYI